LHFYTINIEGSCCGFASLLLATLTEIFLSKICLCLIVIMKAGRAAQLDYLLCHFCHNFFIIQVHSERPLSLQIQISYCFNVFRDNAGLPDRDANRGGTIKILSLY
jgi:hypothetical protein